MRYLSNKDYEVYAQNDILSDVTRGDLTKLASAELSAQGEMESYLNIRYDVQQIFMTIQDWTAILPFVTDVVVRASDLYYTALSDTTGDTPSATPLVWELGDPRHAIIVRWMVVISLYQLYQSLHGYQIPEHRVQEYDNAIKWLKMAAKGEIDPLLPKPAVDDTTKSIVSGGGLTRKDYEY